MVLLVDLGGDQRIVDVGFGAVTPTSPLLLDTESPQKTPHGWYRYVEVEGEWILEVQIRGEWRPMYRFSLEAQLNADYEVANWYTSTHPRSHFLHSLIAAKAAVDGRYTLQNNVLTTYDLDGNADQRKLTSPAEMRHVLGSTFGLRLPEVADLDSILGSLTTAGTARGQTNAV